MLVDLVQATTRDGVRLDGMYLAPAAAGLTFVVVHGTGGNFYSSTLFDALGTMLLEQGVGVLRVNTRGHDGISTAVTARGGRRQGAAYEVVDDCRHDLTAWAGWLREHVGPRVGLLGHSMGAVKCLYATAHEPDLRPECVVAVSPPRLAYSAFCDNAEFMTTYREASALVEAGRDATLLTVTKPLPYVISAGGYVEKYGPEERYNYFRFLGSVRCPVLMTFGSVEAADNMAFRGTPDELAGRPGVRVDVIEGADHFYTGRRDEVVTAVRSYLCET